MYSLQFLIRVLLIQFGQFFKDYVIGAFAQQQESGFFLLARFALRIAFDFLDDHRHSLAFAAEFQSMDQLVLDDFLLLTRKYFLNFKLIVGVFTQEFKANISCETCQCYLIR